MATPSLLLGLHHVTAITAEPRANRDFYTRVLGLRFVKKSVNQDDPGTYHLYYGDEVGSPGSALTFFAWRGLRRGRPGAAQAGATAFAVPPGALEFWRRRLANHGVTTLPEEIRFGQAVLPFADPDGLRLELVFADKNELPRPAPHAEIPNAAAIRGFHSCTLVVATAEATADLLSSTLGHRLVGREEGRSRYATAGGGPGTCLDLLVDPQRPRGVEGTGTVHHVAFRVATDEDQATARARLARAGLAVSPVIDRAYFKSIYFREPGGILFEIATDQPGFGIDEPVTSLGTRLSLPPRLEPHRAAIEALLPPLD